MNRDRRWKKILTKKEDDLSFVDHFKEFYEVFKVKIVAIAWNPIITTFLFGARMQIIPDPWNI